MIKRKTNASYLDTKHLKQSTTHHSVLINLPKISENGTINQSANCDTLKQNNEVEDHYDGMTVDENLKQIFERERDFDAGNNTNSFMIEDPPVIFQRDDQSAKITMAML